MKTNHDQIELPARPMTRAEAADYLRRSTRTIDRMIRSGQLKATNIGRGVLLDASEVASLFHGQR